MRLRVFVYTTSEAFSSVHLRECHSVGLSARSHVCVSVCVGTCVRWGGVDGRCMYEHICILRNCRVQPLKCSTPHPASHQVRATCQTKYISVCINAESGKCKYTCGSVTEPAHVLTDRCRLNRTPPMWESTCLRVSGTRCGTTPRLSPRGRQSQ
jgi:hypothetical protein